MSGKLKHTKNLHAQNMKAQFQIRVQNASTLTEAELIEIVGEEEFAILKQKKPGGIIKAYVLCNESEAEPNLEGEGSRKVSFTREAVVSAFNKLKKGLKFFNRHNSDNSTEGRESFGEVVGKTQKMIDGKLSTVVVGHFPAEKRKLAEKSDIVSMEAVWNLFNEAGKLIAKSVDSITGIALANSAEMTPGFGGAVALATVQAFKEIKMEPEERLQAAEKRPMEYWELRDAVSYRRVKPHQLFKIDEIIGKRMVDAEGKVKYDGGDEDLNEFIELKIIRPIQEQMSELQKKHENVLSEYTKAKTEMARAGAEPAIMKMADEMKLPERVKKLAKVNLDKITIGDNPEQSYKDFLTQQMEFDKTLSSLGYGVTGVKADPVPALGPKKSADDENPFLD
jgi:hypothetical protein